MANKEHVARSKQGFAVWNAWRAKNDWGPVDLREAALTGANLSGADLSGRKS